MRTIVDTLTSNPVDRLSPVGGDTLREAVSLPSRPLLDSLWGSFTTQADTLGRHAANTEITAHEAFGPLSESVITLRETVPSIASLTDHPIFQGIVLLLAVAYVLMLCAHLPDMVAYLARLRSGEVRSGGPTRALHTAVVIGLLLLAAWVVRLCEGGLGTLYGTMPLLVAALSACVGVALFQCGTLYLIGRIVLMHELTTGLIGLKVLCLSVGTLATAPFVLLQILCPPNTGMGWFWGAVGVVGLVVLIFLKESFMLFVTKKVSILHWILYLCAVECLPISFVWLLAVRW